MPAFPASDVPFLCLVGASAASFWRGAWYAMDAVLFPDDLRKSCAASLSIGFGGFTTLHCTIPRIRSAPSPVRGLALYLAALGNVFAWRGVWLGWDIATGTGVAAIVPPLLSDEEKRAMRREHLKGALASHFTATALLFSVRHMTSTLAPPARIGVLSDTQSYATVPRRKGDFLPDVGMFLNAKAMPRQWKVKR
jgi:hypothetical protein